MKKLYTKAEVAQHCRPEDCGIIIDKKVYDITDFTKAYPGGDFILQGAGKNYTAIFLATHPLNVSQNLLKVFERDHCIGEISDDDSCYEYHTNFYNTLKKRVEDYFKSKKVSGRINATFYVKMLLLFMIYITCWYYGLIQNYIDGAILFGIVQAFLAINTMHDFNHGSHGKNAVMGELGSHMMDLLGGSGYDWRRDHQMSHHGNTNSANDNDLNHMPFLRLKKQDELKWYNRY